ncbi:MAG: hypothetical protein ACRBCK_07165 [Alphaproteobacteria bacterium]
MNVSPKLLFPHEKLAFPIQLDSYDYRAVCLFCACMVYALFGSPTPDTFGWAELCVGVLLALSIGIGRARDAVLQPVKKRFWKTVGQFFLIYGLSVPLGVAVVYGHDFVSVIRDLVPFLFLFLPLFLLQMIRARPYYFRSTCFAVLMIGLLFSLRSLFMRYGVGCEIWCRDELLYLENMPSVLFSCLFLIGLAMYFVFRNFSVSSMVLGVTLITLSFLPLVAMVVTLQRASLGAVFLYIILVLGYFIYKSPARAMGVIVCGVFVVTLINLSFSHIFDSLLDKTYKVGLNMRPQEFEAVWNVVTRDVWTFLFGTGWGGHFNSPAVGGLNVNFTHNFFSSVLLKTGLLGIIFCVSYIVGLLERLSRVVFMNPVFGLALAAPILIDLTLYASFKSLDFGLVLLMISSSLVYFRQSESLQD